MEVLSTSLTVSYTTAKRGAKYLKELLSGIADVRISTREVTRTEREAYEER